MNPLRVDRLIGADASRPWPGVIRDVAAATIGAAEMAMGRVALHLDAEDRNWPPARNHVDVLFAPLGFLCRSESLESAIRALVSHVRPGGLIVTEELASAPAGFRVVEPVSVETDGVVIACVEASSGQYRAALSEFRDGAQRTVTDVVVPPSTSQIDAAFDLCGYVSVGRWSDWTGGSASEAPWHVAVHRHSIGAASNADR